MSDQLRYLAGTIEALPVEKKDNAEDDGPRRLKVRFADEEPIRMPWGDKEVYGLKKGEFDFNRLNEGAPFLRDHENSIDSAIGVIEKAYVVQRIAYADIRLDTSDEANEYARKVENGILKDVSMGTKINAYERDKSDKEGRTYRITSWTPVEISAVAIGRIQSASVLELNQLESHQPQREAAMSDAVATQAAPAELPAGASVRVIDNSEELAKAGADATNAANDRVKAVLALGKRFAYAEGERIASEVLADGGGEAEFRAAIDPKLEAALKEQSTSEGQRQALEQHKVGLTQKETDQFSLRKLYLAMSQPANRRYQEEAAFEIEACSVAREQLQMDNAIKVGGDHTIPAEILLAPVARTHAVAERVMQQNELRLNAVDAAGSLVATDLMAGSYIDILRATSVIIGRATQMRGLVGNIDIPRLAASVDPSWRDTAVQNTDHDTDDPTWELVSLRPKKLSVATVVGHTQLVQSTPDVEALIRFDQAYQHGLKVDSAAFNGRGTAANPDEPEGIINQTGVNEVTPTGTITNGWTPGGSSNQEQLRSALIRMRTEVAKANGLFPDAGFVLNPNVVGLAMNTVSGAATGMEGFVYDVRTPARPVLAFPVIESTQVPSDLSKGTGRNLSAALFGSLSTVIYGEWGGGYDVLVDPYTQRLKGGVVISTICHADIALRQPKMLAFIKDIVAA